ncbi:MAG: erythromycin esterase family protein [Myxococcales bacterium]|nr:erythromycin esterase family protein [Myxococcales bacterium]
MNNVPPTAGYWIRAKLGDGYRAIGLFGYAGETRARGATSMDVYPLPAPPTYSMESAVASDNPGRAEVYLPFARLSRAARDWLVLPRRVREFGAGYPGPTGDFDYVPLLEEYDAAVVVRLVVPSTDASDVHTAE